MVKAPCPNALNSWANWSSLLAAMSAEPMARLNRLITPHHEVKLCAVDLTGNGKLDLVTSTDPGTRVTYRSYLEEAPVSVGFLGFDVRPPEQ